MNQNQVKFKIASLLETALSSQFPAVECNREDLVSAIVEAPNLKMGHLAFPTFSFAKALKMGPPQIAAKLIESLGEEIQKQGLSLEVNAAGPYLNFLIGGSFYFENAIMPANLGSLFKAPFYSESPKTMIEYSQPNTHKVLHVGHMRNLCLGNALVRIGRYLEQDIVATTYPGDSGTHVAKCLWYLKKYHQDEIPADRKGAFLGEIYTKANHLLEDEKGTPKEDENRAELTAILKQLEAESGEYFDLWKETREWSLDLMKEAYSWAGVEFDRWFFESEVDAPSLELMNQYHEEGKLVKDQGAIGMDLSDDKLGFCLLVKSDGNGLYATKDVLLAKLKFEEFKIKNNIYVVDNRQALHFKQVFKVLEKLGFEDAKNCEHLQYDVVELPDGAMSSRKGNIVPLMTLIEKMESTITERYLEKYRGEWTDQEITATAKMVANGAIKYGMIRVDNNRKIVFDMDEWLKLDGETGPYLQYVHARIASLESKLSFEDEVDPSKLIHPAEQKLMLKISLFNDIVKSSWEQMKTAHLTSYLFDLGKAFNSFYAECPIGKEEDKALAHARLKLASATREVMKKGLLCLGIEAPNKM